MDTDEINRLCQLGLPFSVAFEVAAGELNEDFEVKRWTITKEAQAWAEDPANRNMPLTPTWDCDPSRFYWALDGEKPTAFGQDELKLLDADIAEVMSRLHSGSTLAEDLWSDHHRTKTSGIGYRWKSGLAVTPPLITCCNTEIIIVGGIHRFHLACRHNALRMPFLVDAKEADTLCSILETAMFRNA